MMIEHLLTDKSRSSRRINLRIMARYLPADLETPVSAFLKLRSLGAKVLLESVEFGITLGRFSFIGLQLDHRIDIQKDSIVFENG